MNEKIKQFAEQAFRYSCEFAQDPNYSPHNPYNGLIEKERYDKKFAELIVKECAGKVDFILREKSNGGGTMGDEIREHFGVEE